MIHKREAILNNGFTIIDAVFSDEEIDQLLMTISQVDADKPTFRRTNDLFAIRQFFKEVPETVPIVFNQRFSTIISQLFSDGFFVVKSIYFDKPANSNWFVSYHQDLTISVDKKLHIEGFGPWTSKQNQFAVQPPLEILQDNFTARIHLDKTDEGNGALRVIPKSHLRGVYRPETIDWSSETEITCEVDKGGVMFMKPLLLHASSRTISDRNRRVLHIEFSRTALPNHLHWSEKISL